MMCANRCIRYGHKNKLYKAAANILSAQLAALSSGVRLTHLSSSQEEVIKAVEKVCGLLPSTLSGQCKDLIETYGQAIIELLVQQADPKTVCTVLALCNDARRTYVRKFSLFTAR